MINIFQRIELVLQTRKLGKENLVIVNSFGTNSHILKPAIDYFSDFFNVHFIDLPGFIKDVPPLQHISVEGYVSYVEKEIEKLNLTQYILGGISFGFFIANKIKIDNRCKAIFAVEPYVGIECVKLSHSKEVLYQELLKIISGLHLVNPVWHNAFFPKFVHAITRLSLEQIENAVSEIDGQTYLETGKILLEEHVSNEFKDTKYVLGINKNDQTVDQEFVQNLFERHCPRLYVLYTTMEHYPKHLTKEYMKHRIRKQDMFEMLRWINK
jgi:hypothetical protein